MIYSKNNNNKRPNEQGFALGGLGGLPFAGKSGFGAYLHHVPDDGKLLVLFAPHVGIDEIGRVGSLQRDGQSKVSSACGAAVGAYKELQKTNRAGPDPLLVMEVDNPQEYDPQLKNIVSLLSTRLGGIEESSDSVAFVTYQMYGIIRELITACIYETPDLFDYATEVAVVGGIMINRRKVSNFSLYPQRSLYSHRVPESPISEAFFRFSHAPSMQKLRRFVHLSPHPGRRLLSAPELRDAPEGGGARRSLRGGVRRPAESFARDRIEGRHGPRVLVLTIRHEVSLRYHRRRGLAQRGEASRRKKNMC